MAELTPWTFSLEERGVIFGPTGEGKSELMKTLLRKVTLSYPVVISDIKHDFLGDHPVWAKWDEPGTIDHPHLVKKFNPKFHVQVIQPDEIGSGDLSHDKLLRALMKERKILYYCDETEGVATERYISLPMRRVWKQGRSLGIGAWVGSQTFSGIPKIFKSQARVKIALRVDDEDVKDVARQVRVPKEVLLNLPRYHWVLWRAGMQHGEVHPPVILGK